MKSDKTDSQRKRQLRQVTVAKEVESVIKSEKMRKINSLFQGMHAR